MLKEPNCRKCPTKNPRIPKFFRKIRGRNGGTSLSKTCKLCEVEALNAARKPYQARIAAEIRSRKKIVCVGPCGKEKPADDKFFSRRPNGVFFKMCRVCKLEYARQWRETTRGKRLLSEWRRSPKGKATCKEHRRRVAADPEWRDRRKTPKEYVTAHVKLRNAIFLGEAELAGRRWNNGHCHVAPSEVAEGVRLRLLKWAGCSVCGEDGPRSLKAWFNFGHEHPLDVTFLCHLHYAARLRRQKRGPSAADERDRLRRAAKTAERYGVPLEVADRLTIDEDEHAEVHARSVAALRDPEPRSWAPTPDQVSDVLWMGGRSVTKDQARGLEFLLQGPSEPRPNRGWRSLAPDEKPDGSSLTMAEIMASPFVQRWD